MSEQRYLQELMARAPVLAFVKDPAGRYLYVNDAWLKVADFDRASVLGRTDHELFRAELADVFVKNDRHVLETGQTIDVEEVGPGDQEPRIGHSTKFALRDAEGRITGVGGIIVDITERYAAQKELQRSETRYRQLIEHSPDAYAVLDPTTGKFVDANDNASKFFKIPREQLLTVGPEELSPPRQPDGRTTAEIAPKYIARALAGENPVFDWIHRAGDGELLPTRVWLAKVDMPIGPGVRATMLDMREIERVRSALERARAQLDAVQDALPQLVVVFDPIRQAVIHSNRTYREMLGEPPAVLLWEAASDACERAVHEGNAKQELQLPTVDGRVRIVEVDVSVFQRDEHGNAVRLLLVASDVTHQRELDAQLRQARRLESLGRLAGGVAHDFNNLLTVILGSAEFLEPLVTGNPEAERDLGALTDAALQAQALTSQLLTFAKADEGRVTAVEVDGLVSGLLRMLKRLLGTHIQTVIDLGAAGKTVLIDSGQLQQIVANLSVNARDAMTHGGTLTIATRVRRLSEGHAPCPPLTPGTYLELTFSDTGSGMSADVAEKAFEPFFTTKERGEGTGLGLSTVFGIVQRARGHVALETLQGRGTTVRVWFPMHGQAEASLTPPAPVTRRRLDARVLLVEDDASVCAVSMRALSAAGYNVTPAESPERALELVKANPRFDIVVSDVVMPSMSGLDLADILRERMRGVPVLFVSGYAEQALKERGMQLSDVELLSKPFSPTELVQRVDAMLG